LLCAKAQIQIRKEEAASSIKIRRMNFQYIGIARFFRVKAGDSFLRSPDIILRPRPVLAPLRSGRWFWGFCGSPKFGLRCRLKRA
jgi:hypothetical protein